MVPRVCLFNRTVDDKPKRPTRKRQAPEDFLGKGPDRKIFMGKYVLESGGGMVEWCEVWFGFFVGLRSLSVLVSILLKYCWKFSETVNFGHSSSSLVC